MNRDHQIRTRGDIHGGVLYVGVGCSACGDLRGGISIATSETGAGFVASWEDFERAYLAAKAYRETEEFRKYLNDSIAMFGPGNGEWSHAVPSVSNTEKNDG